jgi:hypothetical protein
MVRERRWTMSLTVGVFSQPERVPGREVERFFTSKGLSPDLIQYREPYCFKKEEYEAFSFVVLDSGAPRQESIRQVYLSRSIPVYMANVFGGAVEFQVVKHVSAGVVLPGDPGTPNLTPHTDRGLPPLTDGMWEGHACAIIGGGPSLQGFDFDRLDRDNLRVIGINRAFEFCSHVDLIHTMDSRWLRWVESGRYGADAQRAFADFGGWRVICTNEQMQFPGCSIIRGGSRNSVLSSTLEDGLCRGTNSGVSALNLALCLGADPIYLLGFDCNKIAHGKQEHFHNGHPITQKDGIYRRFVKDFREIADQATARARIINVNPESGIRCFEFGDLPDGPLHLGEFVSSSRPKRMSHELDPADFPLFVSAYTPDYEEEAERLMDSLDRLGLDYDIVPVEDLGSWEANCAQKPSVLSKARGRKSCRGRWVVWVDADAEVLAVPEFLKVENLDATGADFLAHIYRRAEREDELLSGTVVIAPGRGGASVLRSWKYHLDKRPQEWDQKALQRILTAKPDKKPKTFAELPPEYCRIYDNKHQEKMMTGDPVVVHYQASRVKKRRRSA